MLHYKKNKIKYIIIINVSKIIIIKCYFKWNEFKEERKREKTVLTQNKIKDLNSIFKQ